MLDSVIDVHISEDRVSFKVEPREDIANHETKKTIYWGYDYLPKGAYRISRTEEII